MKIKVTLFALAVSALSVLGQGQVVFQNSSISQPVFLNNDGSGNRVIMPTSGAFSFYFTYGTSSANLNFTSSVFTNSASTAGRIAGSGSSSISLSTVGDVATFFRLYAYSTSATDYLTASTTPGKYSYVSSIISMTPPGSPTPGIAMFGPTVGSQFQGFDLILTPNVPEPSTIALGALGIGSLLFIRRRK